MIYLVALLCAPPQSPPPTQTHTHTQSHICIQSDSEIAPRLKLRCDKSHRESFNCPDKHAMLFHRTVHLPFVVLSDGILGQPDTTIILCVRVDTCIIFSPIFFSLGIICVQTQTTCNGREKKKKNPAHIKRAPARGSKGYGWTNNPISKVKNTRIINRLSVMFNFQDSVRRHYP